MKKNNSVVFGLSVKFSLILSVTVIAVIFTFFMTLRYFNRQQEYKGFSRNASMVSRALNSGNIEFLDRRLAEAPFFLSYIIYESNTKKYSVRKTEESGFFLKQMKNRFTLFQNVLKAQIQFTYFT